VVCTKLDGEECTVGGNECCSGICGNLVSPDSPTGTCIPTGTIEDGSRCNFGATIFDEACASGRCEMRSLGNRFCCSRDTGQTCSETQLCCNVVAPPGGTIDCNAVTCQIVEGCDPDTTFPGECGAV
jgi:hypothetical protein